MSTQTAGIIFTLDYVKTIGILNNGSGGGRGFLNPTDLAVSSDGRIFVISRCNAAVAHRVRVSVCTLDEQDLGEFGNGYGQAEGQFVWPVAMAFDSRDRLYVTDEYNHRVTVFDSSGKLLGVWGALGSGSGMLNGPAGIAAGPDETVYVVDQRNNRVQKFTTDGRYVAQWGEEGGGHGQFYLPWGVTVDSEGNVLVADWRNDRVQKFDPDGRFVAAFGESGQGEGQLHRPSGVAVDSEGYAYVADWGNERVQVFRPDGGCEMVLRGQATLSKWAREFFDSNPDEKVVRDESDLTPDLPSHLSTAYEVSSQTEPYFWGPVSVKLDREGRLYVTETNRHRFQIYQTGLPVRQTRGRCRTRPTDP